MAKHNAPVTAILALDKAGRTLLERSAERLHLSARGFHRIIRVARSVADLAGAETVRPEHLAEALQYRSEHFDGSRFRKSGFL